MVVSIDLEVDIVIRSRISVVGIMHMDVVQQMLDVGHIILHLMHPNWYGKYIFVMQFNQRGLLKSI